MLVFDSNTNNFFPYAIWIFKIIIIFMKMLFYVSLLVMLVVLFKNRKPFETMFYLLILNVYRQCKFNIMFKYSQ